MSKLIPNAPHAAITYRIIGAAMAIHNEHGPGHREEFYHQAMKQKLIEPPFEVAFEYEPDLAVEDETGRVVFVYRPDLRVEGCMLTELCYPVTRSGFVSVDTESKSFS